jgi:DNA polymerase III subunit gamma/tau
VLSAPNRLAVAFRAKYNSCKAFCERPDQLSRLETAMAELTGSVVRVEFTVVKDESDAVSEPPRRPVSQRQRLAEKSDHPMVRRAIELFDAHAVGLEE